MGSSTCDRSRQCYRARIGGQGIAYQRHKDCQIETLGNRRMYERSSHVEVIAFLTEGLERLVVAEFVQSENQVG